jgi:hypothetical protein
MCRFGLLLRNDSLNRNQGPGDMNARNVAGRLIAHGAGRFSRYVIWIHQE